MWQDKRNEGIVAELRPREKEIYALTGARINTVFSGTIIGYVTEDYAARTGLRAGIPLTTAGGDQQCAALGHGLCKSGTMEITTGTGAYMLQFVDEVPENLGADVTRLPMTRNRAHAEQTSFGAWHIG